MTARTDAIDWAQIGAELDAHGSATIAGLVAPDECRALAAMYADEPRDFIGGELVMTEQRPCRQSRAEVVPLRQGNAAVIAVHQRPVQGTRGTCRVNLRHGVSRMRSGQRHTAGIVFHDAA